MVYALIVCINYDDFLEITLPINKKIIDSIIVITCNKDKKTIEICKKNQVEFIAVEEEMFKNNKDRFNKGKLINVGLESIYKKANENDMVLIIDSDIILSKSIRGFLGDKDCLYGCSRCLVETFDELVELGLSGEEFKINEKIFQEKFLSRVQKPKYIGCGYFQLFLCDNKKYIEKCRDASGSDIVFRRSFNKINSVDNLYAIHLGETKTNWNGRVSSRWSNSNI